MIEIVVLTCLEAEKLIGRIMIRNLPIETQLELVEEVKKYSECDYGNV